MGLLAIIGGSGAGYLKQRAITVASAARTPYGDASAGLQRVQLAGQDVLFLARHGVGHRIPPHRVNYRANLWALKEAGADRVVGLAAVGGITPKFGPRQFAVPHQLIDYTHGRDQSFHEGDESGVVHVDFTDPYCEALRGQLIAACSASEVPVREAAVYGATQGPRLETAAEIARMERDGCDLVGMTGMPEAVLARELGLCYAALAYVVNWAAGKAPGPIRMEALEGHLAHCMERVEEILLALVRAGSASA